MKNIHIKPFRILVTISALFTSLLLIFGFILGQLIYWNSSKMILENSRRYFDQIRVELSLNYQSVNKTVCQTIRILGTTPVMSANSLEERLAYVPIFNAALLEEPNLSALQVGYGTGDFFIVRPINSKYMRKQFKAPDAATLIVDNITKGENNKRYLQRLFFSSDINEISRLTPELTEYDPRIRPWYTDSLNAKREVRTKPYLFHFIQQMGLTVSYNPKDTKSVIGGDVTLYHLSETIAKYDISPRSEMVLVEKDKDKYLVTAYKNPEKVILTNKTKSNRAYLSELGSEILSYVVENKNILKPFYKLTFKDEVWLGTTVKFSALQESGFYLVIVSPESEILAEAQENQDQALIYTIAMILLAIPFIWLIASQISKPLQLLAKNTKRISRFEFGKKKVFHHSMIREVSELGQAIDKMEWTIEHFISLTSKLANEQNFNKLLEKISRETKRIGGADAICTYLVNEKILEPVFFRGPKNTEINVESLPKFNLLEPSKIRDILANGEHESVKWNELFVNLNFNSTIANIPTVLTIPLWNRNKEEIGALCLVYSSEEIIEQKDESGIITLLNAFSGFAAVTLESRKMLKMQKELLESFIKVLADAIDSKSPYTGGHCQRVPVLAKMLAEKACAAQEPPFTNFNLNEQEWEALHIASWLHDCGKVTTPEYVVDKSTKLETIYDRIHEVRMRFEVLKRDAHISYFEEIASGSSEYEAKKKLEQIWLSLDEEFNFVAECNIGGEFMAPDKIDKLEIIASRTWLRTLSDRVGISWEALQRKEQTPEDSLPTPEPLLVDRADHVIPRVEQDKLAPDNKYGFILKTPESLYNKGELYNLGVARGTLTNEERYKINDHIVQTIIMLNKLPFPDHLKDVPNIAGGHHEKIDGTGYPRKLKGSDMSITARMMVVADIFEALTASDRPYKKAKPLSEVIKIMGFMVKDKHIDADLFKLFLTSGAYLEYAEQYLKENQIDAVDINKYLT